MEKLTFKQFVTTLDDLAEIVIQNESYFTELDSAVGDGDLGATLARGFKAIQEKQAQSTAEDIGSSLLDCAAVIAEYCGGTVGPLLSNAFVQAGVSAQARKELTLNDVIELIRSAVRGIQDLGDARVGDKTVIDALVPALNAVVEFSSQSQDISDALLVFAREARKAADGTRDLVASKGRASYLGERSLGFPDPGAIAVAVIAEGLARRRKS